MGLQKTDRSNASSLKAFLISLSEIEFDLQRDGQGRIKETKENYELLARAAALWEKYTKKTSKQRNRIVTGSFEQSYILINILFYRFLS